MKEAEDDRSLVKLTGVGGPVPATETIASSSANPVTIALFVLVVIGGLVLLVTTVRSGNGATAQLANPFADPTEEELTAVNAAIRAQEVVDLTSLFPELTDLHMVYRADDSLALVDFSEGSSTLLEWGVPKEADTVGFLYMSSERGSWVLDPDDLSTALRLAPTTQIGLLADPTRTAVLAEERGTATVFGGFFDGRSIRILASVPMGAEAEKLNLGATTPSVSIHRTFLPLACSEAVKLLRSVSQTTRPSVGSRSRRTTLMPPETQSSWSYSASIV